MGIIEIIALVTAITPKLISAGISVYEIWKDAGRIIGDAEANDGTVDPAAYAKLKERCDQAAAAIEARAAEA